MEKWTSISSNRSTGIIVGVLVMILLAGCASTSNVSKPQEADSANKSIISGFPSAPSSAPIVPDWKEYENLAYGVSFDLPADWRIVSIEEIARRYGSIYPANSLEFDSKTGNPQMLVFSYLNKSNKTMSEIIDKHVTATTGGSDRSEEIVEIDGQQVTQVRYYMPGFTDTLDEVIFTAFNVGDRVYLFEIYYLVDPSTKMIVDNEALETRRIYDQVLASVRLLEEADEGSFVEVPV